MRRQIERRFLPAPKVQDKFLPFHHHPEKFYVILIFFLSFLEEDFSVAKSVQKGWQIFEGKRNDQSLIFRNLIDFLLNIWWLHFDFPSKKISFIYYSIYQRKQTFLFTIMRHCGKWDKEKKTFFLPLWLNFLFFCHRFRRWHFFSIFQRKLPKKKRKFQSRIEIKNSYRPAADRLAINGNVLSTPLLVVDSPENINFVRIMTVIRLCWEEVFVKAIKINDTIWR
jgi:hypothetical protein